MSLTEVITVISALTVVIGIAVSLLNKRIDDLRQDVDKRLDRIEREMDKRFDKIEQDIREIRQLLYKVLEVPHKEDK
ncbi:MAG: hypothetical protein N2648_05115 [Aquificaceae bacterium]|nr:hypothetical protein [Aquificaceae bacterium]MCX7990002.1 hypothetical protein [Aquificaceae bacterium]MDW8294514.1 hypothetical protein [Aquificaceae bacterium]